MIIYNELMEKYYSISLVPQQAEVIFLSKIISQLAQKYHSFPFTPHVTIYGAVKNVEENIVIDATNYALKDIGPFTVQVEKINFTDSLSKTLFLEMKLNETLLKIHSRLREKLRNYQDYILKPHLSLIYKQNLPVEEKEKIILNLRIKKELTFDKCEIVVAHTSLSVEEDLKTWKTIYKTNLKG